MYLHPVLDEVRRAQRTLEDRRREITIKAIAGLRQLAPQLDKKHYLDADATEECWHLRDPSFRGPGPYTLCPAHGFYDWLMTQDVSPSYAMYRDYLQIFQHENPDSRLTMKAPASAYCSARATSPTESVRSSVCTPPERSGISK